MNKILSFVFLAIMAFASFETADADVYCYRSGNMDYYCPYCCGTCAYRYCCASTSPNQIDGADCDRTFFSWVSAVYIAVGVVLVIKAIVIITIVICRRRRRQMVIVRTAAGVRAVNNYAQNAPKYGFPNPNQQQRFEAPPSYAQTVQTPQAPLPYQTQAPVQPQPIQNISSNVV